MTESYSLRDHFAGLAMQASIVSIRVNNDYLAATTEVSRQMGLPVHRAIYKIAYEMADEMLAERGKGASLAAESIAVETENAGLKDQIDDLRGELEKVKALSRKQGRELGEKDVEIERLLGEIKRKDAALCDAIDAFARYEMDVDDDAPPAHREMMARIRAAFSPEGNSPEIPDGWTLSKCGQFIERKGDGVWIKPERVAYYSCFSEEWCVLPYTQDASILGVEYRLPWPPKSEEGNCKGILANSPKPHNPDSLTPEQVGVADGWRPLDEDEIVFRNSTYAIQLWCHHFKSWATPAVGDMRNLTYRTKLTREELRKASGFEGKEAR